MTIQRTRDLLGDKVKDMTDQQVQEMIQRFSQLTDIVLDILPKYLHECNNKLSLSTKQ